jgi:hypothetical protein
MIYRRIVGIWLAELLGIDPLFLSSLYRDMLGAHEMPRNTAKDDANAHKSPSDEVRGAATVRV